MLCTIFSLSKQGTCILQLIDSFCEKYLVLIKGRLCKHCFKNEWILLTSESKKPGQIAIVIHYCNLPGFFWLRRYFNHNKVLLFSLHFKANSSYRQNNNHEKCAGMGLNGFLSKKLDKNHYIKEKKNLLAVLFSKQIINGSQDFFSLS